MVRIFYVLPLALGLVLFPHVIVAYNARILNSAPSPGSESAPAQAPGPASADSADSPSPLESSSKAGAPSTPAAYVEIPNMHQIGATQSQQNKPDFASKAKAPTSSATQSNQGQSTGSQSQNQNPAIEEVCSVTQNKQLCIDSLKAQPLSASADLKSLAFISLNVTKNEANKISEWLYNQLDDPELGAGIQQAYTDCAEQYTDAVAQVEDSMLAFFANAYNDIEVWMNTAIGNAGTCEEAIKTGNALQAMGNRNEVFKQQCSNSLTIISKLMKQ